ncbi:MAG: hypothetical protein HC903_19640, partial [Methylacidiphilales bacterium]|nr:hypothetical protein [Candidatus Methylacidiphilales bacterium]
DSESRKSRFGTIWCRNSFWGIQGKSKNPGLKSLCVHEVTHSEYRNSFWGIPVKLKNPGWKLF